MSTVEATYRSAWSLEWDFRMSARARNVWKLDAEKVIEGIKNQPLRKLFRTHDKALWIKLYLNSADPVEKIADEVLALEERRDIRRLAREFNPNQPRDEDGKWTSGGASAANAPESTISETPNAMSGMSDDQKAAHVKMVLTTGRSVAKELGIDPANVSIGYASSTPSATFTLNGKEMHAAGLAFLQDGKMKLFPEAIDDPIEGTKGVAAHEAEHLKFQTAYNKFKAEEKLVMDDPGPPPNPDSPNAWERTGGKDAVMKPDGSLYHPYNLKYRVYSAMVKMNDYATAEALRASDGVSNYSYEYWKSWKAGGTKQLLAIHETLAEMSRIRYQTGKFPEHMGERIMSWRGEDKPKPSKKQMEENAKQWRNLYRTVEAVYKGEV